MGAELKARQEIRRKAKEEADAKEKQEAEREVKEEAALEAKKMEEAGKVKMVPNLDVSRGSRVRIHGLQSEQGAKLNGKIGRCLDFDAASGRWGVKFSDGTTKALKPINLCVDGSDPTFQPFDDLDEEELRCFRGGNSEFYFSE